MASSFWLWLTYTLVTPAFWAVNNVFDRVLMTRFMKNEYSLTFLGALSRLPFFLIFLAMTGFYVPPFREFLLSFIAGFLVMLPLVFLFGLLAARFSTFIERPDTQPRHLIPKGIAFILVILGIYLLQI